MVKHICIVYMYIYFYCKHLCAYTVNYIKFQESPHKNCSANKLQQNFHTQNKKACIHIYTSISICIYTSKDKRGVGNITILPKKGNRNVCDELQKPKRKETFLSVFFFIYFYLQINFCKNFLLTLH